MTYAPERREAVLKTMMPPNAVSVPELSRTENIAEQTLYRWRKHARLSGRLMPDTDTIPKRWSSADKFAAVLESAAMNETELGEYCRVKGLHAGELAAWRAACEQANDRDRNRQASATERAASKASNKKMKRLEAELARKERALAEAAALLVLRGKLAAMYADEDADG